MKGALRLVTILVVLGAAAPALAGPSILDEARQNAKSAREGGKYGFCTKPRKPMMPRQAELCPLADEVEGCDGFVAACDVRTPTSDNEWLRKLAELLAPVAKALVWVFVALVVIGAAIPVVRAILKWRRDRKIGDTAKEKPNVAVPFEEARPAPEHVSDAEAALRAADEHARRGELDRALALYLAASLAALDRRGAIRLAKHRTNGEYVRACTDEEARGPLREIVREVDRVEYGKLAPTAEAVGNVASRAVALVRVAATAALALLLAGCGALGGGGPDDPAGDDLPRELLGRSGMHVARLESSLATMPMPDSSLEPVLVVVDTARVPLEDETARHLLEWVDAGGHLVLLGDPRGWPKELGAKHDVATTRDLVVGHGFVTGARVARADALDWPHAGSHARLGDRVYAASIERGSGYVFGIANADLFTNIGAARPDNAAALVAIAHIAARGGREMRIARPEDGVPPPSNPFTALAHAGLGRAAWHALGAAILLFLAAGVRQARPRPTAPPARRAFAEHVEATGAFYKRTRAHALALAAYGRYAELRVRERIPRGMDAPTFLSQNGGVTREEAARVWSRATSAKREDDPRGDELGTIKELRAILARVL